MTAPKDGCKGPVIVDLSFLSVHDHSFNKSVSNSHYLGTPFLLKLPTIHSICPVLTIVGNNVKIFKVELAPAFQQLNLDTFDIKHLGLHWKGKFYVDTAVPFGIRNCTLCMQRVTNLIRHILFKQGIFVLNNIDDIIGIAPDDTLNLLNSLGFNLLKNTFTFKNLYLFMHQN
jgi:hypothetical protein